MSKSLTYCFDGARGSGKTGSMCFFGGLCELMKGRTVWSNVPVGANIYIPQKDEWFSVQSKPLDMEALYTFDKGIEDGVVLIDEANLWAGSDNYQSLSGRLLASILQLMRKRKLSFYFTTQEFRWLHNRLRFQTDLLVHCFDLSHKYHDIPEGAFIAQDITDMSGYITGKVFDEHDPYSNQASQVFKFWPFWGIYDTMAEFNPLDIMGVKYTVDKEERSIKDGKVVTKQMPDDIRKQVSFWMESQVVAGQSELTVREVKDSLKQFGVTAPFTVVGRYIKEAGAEYRRSRKGDYYDLTNVSVDN